VTRFAFVDQEKALFDVTVLCRLLKVSRSGFYAWLARPKSDHELADEVLSAQIAKAFTDNRSVYGSPRIHAELADLGVRVSRKRIARLMRQAQIVGCHRRKRSFSITEQNPTAQAAPDLVDRKFVATAPNQLWVADVTYVPTVQGWLYLACVTDVFSRLVLGWSMASHRKTDLVVDAVTMAVHRRGGQVAGVIHHSDRGGEYTSHQLERELRRHGALPSMGSVADCYDNALAESVFATLECELFDQQPGGRFDSRHQAKLAVFDFLEAFYNPRRRHSSLAMKSPMAFEAAYYASLPDTAGQDRTAA
jgi:putative transposase